MWGSDGGREQSDMRALLVWFRGNTDTEKFQHSIEKNKYDRKFPGGLMVRIPSFHCRGLDSIPGRGDPASHTAKKG